MLRRLGVLFLYWFTSLALSLVFVVLGIFQLLPFTSWIVVRIINTTASIELPKDDYWSSLFSWSMLKSMCSTVWLELEKTAKRGKPAPNPHLVLVEGRLNCRLLDFCKGSRPLVVNFCSWTCPVFRAKVGQLLGIVQEFSEVADFVIIYIDEAHPTNGWTLKNNVSIPHHQNLEQRCEAAQMMLNTVDFRCPVVVDTMDNAANQAYAGFPIRLYVIKEGNIEYAGLTGPTFYEPKEAAYWLGEFKAELLRSGRHRA